MLRKSDVHNRHISKTGGVRVTILLPILFAALASCNSTGPNVENSITGSIAADPTALTSVSNKHPYKSYGPGLDGSQYPSVFNTVAVPFAGPVEFREKQAIIAADGSNLLSGQCSGSSICHNETLKNFRQAIRDVQHGATLEKLNHINKIVNRSLVYKEDDLSALNLDQWQTFQQTVLHGSGDCEDFAIAKRALLKRSGIPEEKMFITVLRDTRLKLYHAVLAVELRGQYFILDVHNDMVWTDSFHPNYQPLYSLNVSKSWVHGKPTAQQSAAILN